MSLKKSSLIILFSLLFFFVASTITSVGLIIKSNNSLDNVNKEIQVVLSIIDPINHSRTLRVRVMEYVKMVEAGDSTDQPAKLAALAPRLQALAKRDPQAAEPLIMEALVLCSLAAADAGFASLGRVERARALLLKSITLDPLAMEGTAYITLGNLYYRLPGWPISFGDDERAREALETALKHFPEALDANFFYGDFLLEQGEFAKARIYLEKAEKAPIRPRARLSDLQLKQELRQALRDAREENTERTNFFSRLLASVLD